MTPPSTTTVPPAPCVSPPCASSSDLLTSASSAVAALVDAGVSLQDPRVTTLLSLIARFKSAHPSPPTRASQSSYSSVRQSQSPLRTSPTITSKSNASFADPSQLPSPSQNIANLYNGVPSVILPISSRHPSSTDRSFLSHNQATLATARLALETNVAARVSAPHQAGNAVHGNATTPATPSFHQRTIASHISSPQNGSVPSGPTSRGRAAPSANQSTSQDLPSVFQIARMVSASNRRSYSKRKDSKLAPHNQSSRTLLSPRRRSFSTAQPADVPFSGQMCGDLPAEQSFQIKAQVDAFRRLIRGLDIPSEVAVAARGAPSMSSVSYPAETPLLQRDDIDLQDTSASPSELEPSLSVPSQKQFDPCRIPLFPPNHTYVESDVLLPGEKKLSSSELESRIALLEAHHRRLYASHFSRARHRGVDETSHGLDSFDTTVLQQRAALIDQIHLQNKASLPLFSSGVRSPTKTAASSPAPLNQRNGVFSYQNGFCSKVGAVRRHFDKGVSFGPATQSTGLSSELMKAAAPITTSSSPDRIPSMQTLLRSREKRVSARAQARLHEVSEMLQGVGPVLRTSLLIEQKQLRLLSLQKKIRESVMASMHGTLSRPAVSDISPARVAKTRRSRPLKTGSVWPSATAARGGPSRSEMSHRIQQQSRREARRSNMLQSLMTHAGKFRQFSHQRAALKKRLFKDLDRYFRERSREEERRRKKEQMDRLRALRNKNEDEYLELLKKTKNKRLIQVLRQTDEYLVQIGAQVERQKQTAREEGHRSSKGETAQDEQVVGQVHLQEKDAQSDDDELTQLRKRRNDYYTITHTISEKVHQPKCLVGGQLKPYQLEGLEWLVSLYNNNLNGILADEMGLGKTIQTLSLIAYLVEVKNVTGPFLVIVPLSVVSNWTRELHHWAPSLRTVVYKGDPSTRKHIYQAQMNGGSYHVLLTTYEFIVKDKNVLGRVKWKYIIMDEGHRMKNADCKLALTLGAKYTSRNRLLLTGTPLQNNMTELWALLNFLLPSIFSSAETFETWFNAPFQASALGETAELNEEENLLIISRLHQVLRPFMLRRLKTEVEAQLPDKVEIVLRCDMSIWQRVLYRQMRNRLGIASGAGNVGIRSFNNIVMQLKKVCNHPFLFYQDEELRSIPPDYLMRAAGKFELLDHVLRKLKRTGHRVLIFSQMTAVLDYLEFFLSTIDMSYLRLDGTTKADDRQQMLEVFNAKDSEYSCFLLSTRAGGLGLNLQTADTVIIFDSDWNPMMDLQAQDRAHRIGQTKEVRVFRLICSGSVEVKILERATRKLQIESQVIQAGQFNNKSSDNDRHEMLKDLLKQQTEDDIVSKQDVTSLGDINRYLARSEEEVEVFEMVDAELEEEACGVSRLLEKEDELPAWVFKPEEEEKQKEQVQADYILEHGRGRRKRKQVVYDDNLTEREWTMAMEEEGDIAMAVMRKKRKTMARAQRAGAVDENGDDGCGDDSEDEEERSRRRRKGVNGQAVDIVDVDGDDGESSVIDVEETESGGGSHNGKGVENGAAGVVHDKANGTSRGRKRGRPRNRRRTVQ